MTKKSLTKKDVNKIITTRRNNTFFGLLAIFDSISGLFIIGTDNKARQVMNAGNFDIISFALLILILLTALLGLLGCFLIFNDEDSD